MALGVVALDVRELGRLAKRRHVPIQLPHPAVQRRVAAAYVVQVALSRDILGLAIMLTVDCGLFAAGAPVRGVGGAGGP